MKRRWPYLLLLGFGGFAAAVIALAPVREPLVTIKNRSAAKLTNVSLSGNGFQASIGELAPSESRRISVYPTSESGVRVAFDADGKHFTPGSVGYIEEYGSYRLKLAVESDFRVAVIATSIGYDE